MFRLFATAVLCAVLAVSSAATCENQLDSLIGDLEEMLTNRVANLDNFANYFIEVADTDLSLQTGAFSKSVFYFHADFRSLVDSTVDWGANKNVFNDIGLGKLINKLKGVKTLSTELEFLEKCQEKIQHASTSGSNKNCTEKVTSLINILIGGVSSGVADTESYLNAVQVEYNRANRPGKLLHTELELANKMAEYIKMDCRHIEGTTLSQSHKERLKDVEKLCSHTITTYIEPMIKKNNNQAIHKLESTFKNILRIIKRTIHY